MHVSECSFLATEEEGAASQTGQTQSQEVMGSGLWQLWAYTHKRDCGFAVLSHWAVNWTLHSVPPDASAGQTGG